LNEQVSSEKPLKGIYVLIIRVDKSIQTRIGALGDLTFNGGLYAYVGSAQNNLERRVLRHQRKEKRLFWHIDYLLNNPAAKIIDALYKPSGKSEECKIASLLAQNGCTPIIGFGCSDCQCSSHLFQALSFDFLRGHMLPLKVENEQLTRR
jgi:Uri superfamily endonuclease